MRHLFLLLVTTQLFAQDLLPAPRFPNSAYFRERFSSPTPPRVELQPPLRLTDFVAGDKLELSLRSYLDLVLANNTDIQIQRLSIEPSRNAITRAYGRFDPLLNLGFTARRSTSPATSQLEGAAIASSLNQPLNFGYDQLLESGTRFQVAFGGTRNASNSAFANVNPSISSNLGFSFTQPLLQNRGGYVNRLNIMVARSQYRQSEYQMSDQIMRILQQAELAYWSVIQAREFSEGPGAGPCAAG